MFKFRPTMQTLETRENPSGPELIDGGVTTPPPSSTPPAETTTTPPPETVPANP